MAYQAFYNKYRPQTFEEVVGQKAIVTTLKNAILEDKIAHAYLFCGPRGTGKTTMARLFAKALNCQEGVGKQCNHCESCEKIMKGQHPDVIEIDAASNSTVDSVRQLIENVSYRPIMSPYKVYIIDEVHNMSDSAFNALLKTIEEPPSFVIFILATTDPQKVLPTILSRVQRFDFSKVSEEDLIRNEKRVLDTEKIQYDEEALRLIASLSMGGVRDSLSLLDKVVSYCGEKVTFDEVNEMMGLLSLEEEITLINQIEKKQTDVVIKTIQEKFDNGLDIRRLESDFIQIYKDFLLFTLTKDASLMERLKESEAKKLSLSLYSARRNLDILIQCQRDHRLSDDFLTQFELALINMMSEPLIQEVAVKQTEKKEAPKQEVRKAVEVKTEKKDGMEFKPENVEVSTDEITCSKDELLYLMYHFDNNKRTKFTEAWKKLSNFFATDYSFEARALTNSVPRLFSEGILVVTCKYMTDIKRINGKNIQNRLVYLMKQIEGEEVNVLPIFHDDFQDAIQSFKKKEQPKVDSIHIDFGQKQNLNASTDFFNDLMKGE